MAGEQGWRTDIDAETYFGSQKKKLEVADRRPVIRKPSDLGLGPGFSAQAVRITDFNDLLATYNGFFAAEIGAFGAPNDEESFVGIVVNDAEMGGVQRFTGMESGVDFRRLFRRNPSNAESIFYDAWTSDQDSSTFIGFIGVCPTNSPPSNWLICNGGTFDDEEFPDLFTFLGTTTLPDLRNRTIYGVGSAWPLNSTDGLVESARTKNLYHQHTLGTYEAGEHSHSISSDGSHSHGSGSLSTSATSQTLTRSDGGGTTAHPAHTHGITGSTASAGGHSHGGSVGSGGSHFHYGITFDELSSGPLLRGVGMNYIIRAK